MTSAISGVGANWAAQAMTGASMRSSPAQKMSNLFSQIDTGNTGSISKAQFTQAFNALNPPSSFKAITKQEFVSGMTQMMSEVRQQKHQAYAQQAAATPAQTIDASLSGMSQLAIGSHINVKA
jgi:hypothetical protein